MTPPAPVPSKAALHALRGVLLTTSCSVLLLSEERRRRLKLARTVAENSRKLHSAKGKRTPAALIDGLVSWDVEARDWGDEALSASYPSRDRASYITGNLSQCASIPLSDSRSPHQMPANCSHISTNAAPTSPISIPAAQTLKVSDFHEAWILNSELWRLNCGQTASNNVSTPRKKATARTRSVPDGLSLQQSPPHENIVGEPWVALERLLEDMESIARCPQKLDMAVGILRRLESSPPLSAEAVLFLEDRGLRLLRLSLEIDTAKTTAILTALLRLHCDAISILPPYFRSLQNGGLKKLLNEALEYLSGNSSQSLWMHGFLVFRVFERYAESNERYEDCKGIYLSMLEAGLFSSVNMASTMEYRIRHLMAVMALNKGDDAFARNEIRAMLRLDGSAISSDLEMQSKIIMRDAILGKWNAVEDGIRTLRGVADSHNVQLQEMLIKVTDAFAQSHSAEEFELFFRRLADAHELRPRQRWVFGVLDWYASRHELDPMFSWLRFCSDRGLRMGPVFFSKFYVRCRKYWSFSDKSIDRLQSLLRGYVSHKAGGLTTGQSRQAAQAPDQRPRLETLEDEGQAATPASGQGDNVKQATNGETWPGQALRLAVLKKLSNAGSGVDEAIALVRSAYEQGQDVNGAVTPLLLARLRRGEDPEKLISEAMRMGARIHDSAFNKAAQALSARGDLRAAVDMCEMAAKENGKGKLLYNEYMFANLVFAYTGLTRYHALQRLLSDFTSQVQWWRGSRTCKESIKLAMKTAAMRSVVQTRDGSWHRQALERLDEALQHVKLCRSDREQRQAVMEAFAGVVRRSAWPGLTAAAATEGGEYQGGSETRGPRVMKAMEACRHVG